MRITCRKDILAERLAVVGRAASTRAGMQVASGIRITATSAEEPLELAATDLELSLRVPADAEQVHEPGSVVVPARLAQEIIRALPGETVTLAADGPARLRVSSGSGEYALHAFPADDFPRLPEPDPERAFTLDRKAVVATIDQVARAASRDESRPVLTGVLVHFEAHALTMAATDSYRLAVREQPLEGGSPEPLEAIVPARALQEVARLAGSGEGDIEVVVQDNLVGFGIDGVQLTARRIDGQFPNFRSLLPGQPHARADAAARRGARHRPPCRHLRPSERAGPRTRGRRRADHLGADARRRRRPREPADGVQRRAVRDRLQPRVPARRHRGRRRATSSCCA